MTAAALCPICFLPFGASWPSSLSGITAFCHPEGESALRIRREDRPAVGESNNSRLRGEACGVHAFVAGLRGRRLRPVRRKSAATSCRQRSTTVFLCTFGLTQKKKSSTAKSRGCRCCRSLSGHERLRLSHTRSGRSRRCRHFLRAFRSAIVQAFGLRKRRIPMRGWDIALYFYGRSQTCMIPRCENVGRRSRRTPSARNDRAKQRSLL